MITQLFILFKQKDEELIKQLRKHCASSIVNDQWQFSLSDLYDFSCSYFQSNDISYPQFRSLLFNSTINQDLAKSDLKIDILINQQHVDKSIYCLVKI